MVDKLDFFNNEMEQLTRNIAQQKDDQILKQLNELISRGIIAVQETTPVLTSTRDITSGNYIVTISQAIALVPKEFEYIKKLEAENQELKTIVKKLKDVLV